MGGYALLICRSQTDASINKKRIVDLSWGFGHSQGCGVGQVVIFSQIGRAHV